MTEMNDEFKIISVPGLVNWIFLLLVFSIITTIGNCMGYRHPISESLIGMIILSLIALSGVWMENNLPFKIPSIIYIIIIGFILAFPLVPTSAIIIYYVSEVEIISIVTVFLAYVGIGMGNSWDEIRSLDWKALILTMIIITALYVSSGIVTQFINL
ncbi:MAG: hypothetical protein IJ122_01265 [Methanobrevibacter sp.]|nr:hypothetical protein [Methanobrevibacter sp.]